MSLQLYFYKSLVLIDLSLNDISQKKKYINSQNQVTLQVTVNSHEVVQSVS